MSAIANPRFRRDRASPISSFRNQTMGSSTEPLVHSTVLLSRSGDPTRLENELLRPAAGISLKIAVEVGPLLSFAARSIYSTKKSISQIQNETNLNTVIARIGRM